MPANMACPLGGTKLVRSAPLECDLYHGGVAAYAPLFACRDNPQQGRGKMTRLNMWCSTRDQYLVRLNADSNWWVWPWEEDYED